MEHFVIASFGPMFERESLEAQGPTLCFFANVPPPRAIIGDVPLLETVPLLFQPHFRGLLPCQIHVRHTHFRGFSPVQIMNLHGVLIMETEHFIF